ncbi:MAG TPA: DoxX family protein [Roseiflexaceae bacterium]|nr:DoxX family protein [Roseiflexaceae bacterium]
MIPFALLIISLVVFRALGTLGIDMFGSWPDAARYALALMFLFTAATRLTPMREDLIRMVPRWLLYPRALVYLTGLLEAAGAIGLLIPSLQRLAGLGLAALLLAMFPANVNAASNHVPLRGRPPTPLWLRLPMQLVFLGLTWWATQ